MTAHWLPSPLPHHSYAHVNELAYQAIRRALFPTSRTREIRRDAGSFRRARKAVEDALRASVRQGEGRS